MRTPTTTPTFAPEVETASAPIKARRVAANGATKPAKAKAAGNGKVKAKGKAKAARNVDPAKLDDFGLRKGSIKSKAAAMYALKGGATLGEVKAKLDSVQFNVIKELREKGYTVVEKQEDGEGNRKVNRYFLKRK